MVGGTRLAEPADGIGHLLVREDVDALVHHGHGGVRAAHAVGPLRGDMRHEFAAARVAARHVRRHVHVQRAVARGDLDRHHAPGAVRGVSLAGRGGLHHAQRHVHARRQIRLDRLKLDLSRRVRERDDAGVGDVAVHHLQPGIPLERRLHRDARHVAGMVERLVRHERHMRRRGERGPHGRVVVRAAHPVGRAERDVGGGVAQRHGVVAARRAGHLERGDSLRRHAHLHGLAHRVAHLVAHPLEEAVVVALEPVDVLDALEPGLELPRAGVRRAVGIDERHAARLRPAVLAQHVRQHHADVVGVDVERAGGAARGGTSARLEHKALCRHLHGRARTAPRRQRGRELGAPLGVQRLLVQRLVVRLETAVLVAEAELVPAARRERLVRERHGPLDRQPLRGTAEEMLGRDRERDVRRGEVGRRLHLHADLRRHELLDPDVPRADDDVGVAGHGDVDTPSAAHLAVRNGEGFRRHGARFVNHLRLRVKEPSVRVDELDLHRECLLRRISVRPAQERVHEDLLVVAVDAAVGPHERLERVLCHVLPARALLDRLVEGLAEREEGHVAAILPRGDDRERVRVLRHLAGAPAVGLRDALAHEDVVGAVHRHEQVGDRRALRERRRPHVHAPLRLAHGKPDVREAHEAVPRLPRRIALLVARRDEVHPVRGDAVLVADVEGRGDLLVEAFRQLERLDLGFAGDVLRLLRIAAPAVVAAVLVLLARKQLHDVRARHGPDRAFELLHVHRLDGDGAAPRRRQVASAGGELDRSRTVRRCERAAELAFRHAAVRHRQTRLDDQLILRARLEIRRNLHALAPTVVVRRHGTGIRRDLNVLQERRQIGRVRYLDFNAFHFVQTEPAHFRILRRFRLFFLRLRPRREGCACRGRICGRRACRGRCGSGRTCHARNGTGRGHYGLRTHAPSRLTGWFCFRIVTAAKG